MRKPTGGPDARRRLRLAAVVWAVLLAQVLLYPGLPGLVVALGAPAELDGGMWFLVAEYAAFVLCAGLWGAASDAAGRRVPFIALGALGGAAGYALVALAPTLSLPFGAVLAARVLQGAFTIAAFSLAMTMLMDLSGGHGRNMGAAGIAIGLGTAMGAPLGGQLSGVDVRAPLVGAAVLLACVVPLVARIPDEAPETRRNTRAALARLRTQPALSVPYAFGFIDRLTAGFFALVGTYYFQTAFGLDAAATGLVLALFFGPFALLQYPMGVLSDRIGRFVPVIAGSLLYGTVIVAIGLAPTLATAAGLMVLVGVFGALVSPATMALVTDLVAPEERGAAMGGFNVFGSLGFLVGFLVGGFVADGYGFQTAFAVTGLLEIGIAVGASGLVRRLAPESASTPG